MSSSASATAVYNLNRKCDLYGRADARRAGICRLGMEESRLDRFARVSATTLVCDRVLSQMDVRLGMILNLVCLFGTCVFLFLCRAGTCVLYLYLYLPSNQESLIPSTCAGGLSAPIINVSIMPSSSWFCPPPSRVANPWSIATPSVSPPMTCSALASMRKAALTLEGVASAWGLCVLEVFVRSRALKNEERSGRRGWVVDEFVVVVLRGMECSSS